MPRYHGNKGAAYGSTTLAGTATPFLAVTSWTLDMTTDKIDVTAMQDTNKQYVQGLRDIKGTFAAWWDSSDDSLFDAAESADGLKMYLYPSTLAPTIYFYGPAFIDASIAVSATGAVSQTGNFVAAGNWGRKP